MSGGIQATLRPYQERIAELEERVRTLEAALRESAYGLALAEGRLMTIDATPSNGWGRPFNGDILPKISSAWNLANSALKGSKP